MQKTVIKMVLFKLIIDEKKHQYNWKCHQEIWIAALAF